MVEGRDYVVESVRSTVLCCILYNCVEYFKFAVDGSRSYDQRFD